MITRYAGIKQHMCANCQTRKSYERVSSWHEVFPSFLWSRASNSGPDSDFRNCTFFPLLPRGAEDTFHSVSRRRGLTDEAG
jgi:hypothetical protein